MSDDITPDPVGEDTAPDTAKAPPPTRVVMGCHADLLSALPYAIGVYPRDNLCVVATDSDGKILFCLLKELPDTLEELPGLMEMMIRQLSARPVDAVVLIGYGTVERVTPAVAAATGALAACPIEVTDALRVHNDRYWSYQDNDPATRTAGIAFDPTRSQAAASAARLGGPTPVDQLELKATLAPQDGAARAAMRHATKLATEQITASEGEPASEVANLIGKALTLHAEGERLTDADAARLSVLLGVASLRDAAWASITAEQLPAHLALWTDMTRRSVINTAASACLLAYTHWLNGDSIPTYLAVQRALEADPGYGIAQLMADLLVAGSLMPGRSATPGPARPDDSRPPAPKDEGD